jgi:hypothetical protein
LNSISIKTWPVTDGFAFLAENKPILAAKPLKTGPAFVKKGRAGFEKFPRMP